MKNASALYYSKLLQTAKGAALVLSDIALFAPVTVSMGGPAGLIVFPDVQHKPHCYTQYTVCFMQAHFQRKSRDYQCYSSKRKNRLMPMHFSCLL